MLNKEICFRCYGEFIKECYAFHPEPQSAQSIAKDRKEIFRIYWETYNKCLCPFVEDSYRGTLEVTNSVPHYCKYILEQTVYAQ